MNRNGYAFSTKTVWYVSIISSFLGFKFDAEDFLRIQISRAFSSVYADTFPSLACLHPWQDNTIISGVMYAKVGDFWSLWEYTIVQMIIEHGVPISFKLGDEGILSPDQVDKILELAAWSEKSNPACMLARLLSTLLPILPVFLQICDTISFSSELFIRMVWSDLLNLWNEALCITLCTKMKAAFSLKLSIPRNSIYNFTQVEIDPRMKELLAHGPSHIPVFIDSPDNISLALDDLDQFCIGLAAPRISPPLGF